MLSLQKLQQNIVSMQQQSPLSSLAGLQGLANLTAASLNSPLNLSIGGNIPALTGNISPGLDINPTQMPQLILASGHLVQGIQAAQLLIPTPQGIATQTILTIPVSQQMNANEQLVQSLGLNGGSISPSSSLLSPPALSTSVQQLLTAIQPQIFSSQTLTPSATLSGSGLSTSSQPPMNVQQHPIVQTPKSSPPRNTSASSLSSMGSSHHHDRLHIYEKPLLSSPSTTSTSTTPSNNTTQSHGTAHYSTNGHSQISTSPHQINSMKRSHSPTSMALNNINRYII